ncbi:hypothetical protein FKW77_009797 [Venturia effusa]|uniref:deoxyribose-phosphate aldolase n=1 Tax=Venturia effusa TaxID=50376 RepID=A0A517LBS2_9PEZI|nr:hypothetical protein FKW77_009797 [Venturia effusa]
MPIASSAPDWPSLFSATEHALQDCRTAQFQSRALSPAEIAAYIDHTLLKLDATSIQITNLCEEAKRYGFGAVCVRLDFVAQAVQELKDNPSIGIACVIGFHEGTQPTASKISEAAAAIEAGATELDIVLNRTQLQSGLYDEAYSELQQLRALSTTVVLKLIAETSRLSPSGIMKAAVLAHAARFDYIKTSTGFDGRGASSEDIILMRACCIYLSTAGGPVIKVKASGGVRGYEDAKNMIALGAERIGASSGVKIVQEALRYKKNGEFLGASEKQGVGS